VTNADRPTEIPKDAERSEYWTNLLGGADAHLPAVQRTLRRLPSPPRCKLCQAPFSGPFAPLLRLLGFRRWALNQQICRFCVRDLEKHSGGAEILVSLLYVDVRGSTEMAEQMNPRAFSDGINRYLALVGGDVDEELGVIDHMAGDGVMAMWIPAFVGPEHPRFALRAGIRLARDISASVERGDGFPAGVGIHTGEAYVGVVGHPGSRDFTVVGDTANTVARLSDAAAAGEVVVSQAALNGAAADPSSFEHRSLTLKGKAEPFDAWVWKAQSDKPDPLGIVSDS
jgi:adenylate cyclase